MLETPKINKKTEKNKKRKCWRFESVVVNGFEITSDN